ncbi:MAG: alpha/beta hydrolase [Bacillota bacterium]
MILHALQLLLILVYAVLPIAFFGWAVVVRYRRGRSSLLVSFFLACTVATVLGTGLLLLNAYILGGRVLTGQSLQFLYFVVGAICLIKLLDSLLLHGAFRLARVQTNALGHPVPAHHTRALMVLAGQRLLIFALIVPYVTALMVIYRPKITLSGDPKRQLGLSFASAQFITRDGLSIAGWWIPAPHKPSQVEGEPAARWGLHTIILCHGIGSAKERELALVRYLAERGYNVLAFDFRGHGQSDGSFISFGSRERYDVLAAVQWVKANHPEQAQRVYGIGMNTGAAALLAAAADQQQGRQIDALVLYEPYSRFRTLAAETSRRALPGPMRWLFDTIGLPLASLHAGVNLTGFSPIEFARSIWPRPVLVIHGRGMTFIPVYEEMDLYGAMSLPKRQFWPAENYAASRERLRQTDGEFAMIAEALRQWIGTSINLADDPAMQDLTYEFLQEAQPLPAI